MRFIDAQELEASLHPLELIEALRTKLREGAEVPARGHHTVESGNTAGGTLLIMPAWQRDRLLILKSVTVFPDNPRSGLPTVMGFYALMSAATGEVLAIMDARVLTAKRTAAASALAAEFLARKEARHLLMVGTGALAPHMVRAHAAVRPITKVSVFGRTPGKVDAMLRQLAGEAFELAAVTDLERAAPAADIICCATTATDPILAGDTLQPGTHVDLVGAYRADRREADTAAVARSSVYVDERAGALREAGDLVIPLREGAIDEGHIRGDLFGLCRNEVRGRTRPEEITLFKSVGMALEDLAAAELAYRKCGARREP